ncbi:BTB/POZ protein [Rhizophagus clarus]|uniref:BTB/POZ protein n=1 Tax=Rhizophagus clarus TaxID=94130 RepID=A0A8H3LW99_9GLOM|nr:BTB/POZ protein [Rhizophagus clarus]
MLSFLLAFRNLARPNSQSTFKSTYFRTALSKDWARKENDNIIIFKKPNISPEIIELILKYICTGNHKQNGEQLLNLLIATDELNLEELGDFIQNYLVENREKVSDNDIIDILQDRLGMKEIVIWKYVLENGVATHHYFTELFQWTSSNLDELKEILHDPNFTLVDIIKYHSAPTTTSKSMILFRRSNLINPNSKLLDKSYLASWIDRKDKPFYNFINIPYSFEFTFHANRNGFEIS